MDQITERRTPSDVASEVDHEFCDLTVFPSSVARNGYARPGPRTKGVVECRTDRLGRQTPSNIVDEQLRDLGGIDRLSHPGGAGKIAIGGATEARSVHDPIHAAAASIVRRASQPPGD